tara:strand:+ start:309 stop:437 length:129 start_codon:yes stop_codon:yes gene_type:complete
MVKHKKQKTVMKSNIFIIIKEWIFIYYKVVFDEENNPLNKMK